MEYEKANVGIWKLWRIAHNNFFSISQNEFNKFLHCNDTFSENETLQETKFWLENCVQAH
jgi:hypothetical protein